MNPAEQQRTKGVPPMPIGANEHGKVTTTKGVMDESQLKKKDEIVADDEREITRAVEYWLGGRI